MTFAGFDFCLAPKHDDKTRQKIRAHETKKERDTTPLLCLCPVLIIIKGKEKSSPERERERERERELWGFDALFFPFGLGETRPNERSRQSRLGNVVEGGALGLPRTQSGFEETNKKDSISTPP